MEIIHTTSHSTLVSFLTTKSKKLNISDVCSSCLLCPPVTAAAQHCMHLTAVASCSHIDKGGEINTILGRRVGVIVSPFTEL